MMHSMKWAVVAVFCGAAGVAQADPLAPFDRGEAIGLETIPANERGILCLLADGNKLYGGTTGRQAHLFAWEPAGGVRILATLPGGVGFAHALVKLPDGSLIGGTQADPTGIALKTDPKAVGHLYRFTLKPDGPAVVEDLGVPVAGQGIYTLAEAGGEVLGNTWPDGHFFTYDIKAKTFKDHGAIAGYRTFERPEHAEDINRGTTQGLRYPRQVSRAIIVDSTSGAYTGGADGFLHRYDFTTKKVEKLDIRLPSVRGRESWASLDAVVWQPRLGRGRPGYAAILGGTSDSFLFELRFSDPRRLVVRTWGKPSAQATVVGLAAAEGWPGAFGIVGGSEGVPRSFAWTPSGDEAGVYPGGIPLVDGQACLNAFGAFVLGPDGDFFAGEQDRIGRLVRFRLKPKEVKKEPPPPPKPMPPSAGEMAPRLPYHVSFAPAGTTTDGSGYTAIEVGKDGKVYVGAARYGDYGWLLRLDPAAKPIFLEKVVSMRQLTGEDRSGINTQGKIHAKIVVGADGKVWFASKQAHEIFDTRPEYGEDPDGFPGGHLCYYDPKTGFSRSMGILKKQEGLMAGIIDDARGKLYFRSEPKNHFLVYDIATGRVQDRGTVGAFCRYMTMERTGVVWTVGRGTTLSRYDPATGYVEDYAVKVEGASRYEPPYVLAAGPNGKLYGVTAGHPSIMEFDADSARGGPFPEIVMRNVAPAAPAGYTVDDIHAAIFGKDGRFYYPLNTTGPVAKGSKPEQHLRLMRFDPATKKTETVGIPEPVGFDEEKVKSAYARVAKFRLYYMQGAAVAPDGTLFLLGIYPQLHVAWFPGLTAPTKR
jgi:streptogramin lyase